MAGRARALVALCLVPVIHSASLPPAVRPSGRSELIEEAVADYNKGSDTESVFMLLADEHDEKTEPEELNKVKFTIKETVCQKSEQKTTKRCEYKAGGVEKRCLASIKSRQFTVVCSAVTEETNKDGGHVVKPSQGGVLPQERTVIIAEKQLSPDAGVVGDEEEIEEDDDYHFPDTVIEFHDDHDGDVPDRRSQSGEPRAYNGGILGRLLCLKCIIDIFPRK